MSPIATTSLFENISQVTSKVSKLSTKSKLIDELTLGEKVFLTSGRSFCDTSEVKRLNIPSIKVSDGPSGCRGELSHDSPPAAAFPNAACIASTFDVDLVERVGKEIGKDSHSKSVNVLIGPTINLHRDPRGGRNFECFSEDPILTGVIASAYVKGLQSENVGACLKHLVCNERETNRKSYDVKVSDAALREVYIRPFEEIIKRANPWSIMSAYNDLNGVPCSQSTEALNIVREEFGYDGLIMSDWFGTKDGIASLEAGVDLEMPFPVMRGGKLIEAVRSGRVSMDVLDTAVRRMLELGEKTAALRPREAEKPFNGDKVTIATCRQTASEGLVLLRNDNGILPLKQDQDILVIGEHASSPSTTGGGSAMLNTPYTVTPLNAIKEASSGKITYYPGVPAWRLVPELRGDKCGEVTVEIQNVGSDEIVWQRKGDRAQVSLLDQYIPALGPDFTVTMKTTIKPTKTGKHLLSVFCVAETKIYLNDKLIKILNPPHVSVEQYLFERFDFENIVEVDLTAGEEVELRVESKSKPKTGMEPPAQGFRIGLTHAVDEDKALDEVEALAENAGCIVLMTGLNADWEGEGTDRKDIKLPRRQEELVRRLAKVGKKVVLVNQSGSPIDFRCADGISGLVQAFYGGMECGNSIADVLFGKVNPSGKLAMTFPKTLEECPTYESFKDDSNGLIYEEGSIFGYRAYQKQNIKPAYPFGFGLSYTDFEWSNGEISKTQEGYEISVTVKNNGQREGRDVVQLYVSRGTEEPFKLEGLAKTQNIKVGGEETVKIEIGSRAFARWIEGSWKVKEGVWRVSLNRDCQTEVVGFDVAL